MIFLKGGWFECIGEYSKVEERNEEKKACIHIKDLQVNIGTLYLFPKLKREIPYLTEEFLIIEGTSSICIGPLLTRSFSIIIIIIIIRSEMIVLMWYCLLNDINLRTISIKIEDHIYANKYRKTCATPYITYFN